MNDSRSLSLRPPQRILDHVLDGLRARESPRTVDQYMEAHVVLPKDSPWDGPYRFDRMELWRTVAQACSPDDPCQQVTIMGPAQCGKSTLINGVLSFYADADPSAMAIVLPTAEDAPDYQRERLGKLYEASPRLAAIAGKRADRKQRDNAQVTEFSTGARLLLLGAGAPGTYRSRPLRVMILDDVDAFPAAPEGDHVGLALGRTGTYRMLGRKVIVVSSPGDVPSIINREYLKGSQEQLWVPCPACKSEQVLDPARMIWEPKRPETARMVCAYATCQEPFTQEQMPAMVRAGEWRALHPERMSTHRSFWLWQGYVPPEFAGWTEYAQDSIDSMIALREHNDERARQTFQNIRNARPWEPAANRRLSADAAAAYERAEIPWDDATLPIIVKTASTDCQHNRLETTLLGWGREREAWALDHSVHHGAVIEDEVWDQVCDHLVAAGVHVWIVDAGDGEVHNDICAQMTRLFPRLLEAGILAWGIKNFAGAGKLWPKPVQPGNPKDGMFAPVSIYADAAIGWVYAALAKETRAGANVLHVPKRSPFVRAWYRQVFTKRRRTSTDRPGKSPWVKPSKKARDEALDCLYLGRVAIEAVLTPDERGNTLIPGIRDMILGVGAAPERQPDVARLLAAGQAASPQPSGGRAQPRRARRKRRPGIF